MYTIKYVRYLERLIKEVVIANPVLGPMHVLKEDVSDGLYHISLRPTNDPTTGLVFP